MTQPDVRLSRLLAIALVIACAMSMLIGASRLPLPALLDGLTGTNDSAALILREIRLPRMILAASVGFMLGLAGAAIQALTRNALAEPAVLGTPQAAALGAVAALYSGAAKAGSIVLMFSAIVAAGLAMALMIALIRQRQNILTLLLTGLGIGSLCGAAMSLVISLSPNPYAVMEIVFWLMGSFEDRSLGHVIIALPFLALGAGLLYSCRNSYTALTLGEEAARSLGIDTGRLGLLTALGISVGIGASVAVSGAIGFVGLIAPHIVRPWCAGDPGRTLVPAALCGALLTTVSDVLVRLIPSTSEIRIGVLTAMIGAPMFIWLVISRRGLIAREQ
mgnify:CR=1 FL=1